MIAPLDSKCYVLKDGVFHSLCCVPSNSQNYKHFLNEWMETSFENMKAFYRVGVNFIIVEVQRAAT